MTQTILITGTSSGFGEATANYFARQGWNVVATMRNPEASKLTSEGNVLVTRLDVQDRASIEDAIANGIARFGRIDALVNNAGYGLFSIFERIPREAIQQQFDVNVFGLMDVTRAILPHFRASRAGTIVNITSGAGIVGFPFASIYSASKFAVEGFSEALSYELGSLGIKVKIIEPGGAPQTNFMARTGAESANGQPPHQDYAPFLDHVGQMYGNMAGGSDEDAIEKVVAAIYAASTDQSDRLRYTPTNDIQPLVNARRGSSEDRYNALVQGIFAMKKA
ncbi:SDR family oxidoreductase [Rhizobium sp. MC63]|uniref:SDR family oxidoreductase n=1 Tax=Rhizobium mulingense TaxID=3031128 RepID=A0ACC6MS97_9HYPH|nr:MULTISPECIES: SDR family oxidoreductase [unclassified Rhizobium]MDF0696117.1 SDR family oxidoreductase [Rhizobium sp. MC63]MEA3516062.1 SDR family oxidoreductase [Rhizobium sp. MJ31]